MLKFNLSSDVNIYPAVSPIINPEYPLLDKFIWFLILVISLYYVLFKYPLLFIDTSFLILSYSSDVKCIILP